MTERRPSSRLTYDPIRRSLAREYETSSRRIQAKFRNPYAWCFCELCSRSTEFATAIESQIVFRRIRGGTAEAVALTDAVRAEAKKEADELVRRYERALAGEYGIYEAGKLLFEYCDPVDMGNDRSIAAFRDQVERRMLTIVWARRGDLSSTLRLQNQREGAAKPSKLYCERHNPRRSDEARRAYQRDLRFAAEFEELMRAIWTAQAHKLPTSDIKAHAYVRRVAYRQLQIMKKPTKMIGELQTNGVSSQAEIARQLGVSRQAVSAAIKRQKNTVTKA